MWLYLLARYESFHGIGAGVSIIESSKPRGIKLKMRACKLKSGVN
jgi:hypothetical protein